VEAVESLTRQPVAKANILLVDDHPANRLVVRTLLEELNQTLVEASTGQEALERVSEQEFAVVLLDVQMPDLAVR
jgi:CheY-like chemotaxis protein